MRKSLPQQRSSLQPSTSEALADYSLPKRRAALHLLGGEEQKDYYCERCGKAYKLKSSLANHKKYSCARQKTFFCVTCHVGYFYKHHLQRHVISVHGNQN